MGLLAHPHKSILSLSLQGNPQSHFLCMRKFNLVSGHFVLFCMYIRDTPFSMLCFVRYVLNCGCPFSISYDMLRITIVLYVTILQNVLYVAHMLQILAG